MVDTKLMNRDNIAPRQTPHMVTPVEVCMRKDGKIDPTAKSTTGIIRN